MSNESHINEPHVQCPHELVEISEPIEGIDEMCYNYKCKLCGEHRLEFQNMITKKITGTDIYIQGE